MCIRDRVNNLWKLGDFGMSYQLNDGDSEKTAAKGSPLYMSPQLLYGEDQKHTNKTDIWSLGVVMYMAIYGQRPWTGNSIKEFIYKLQNEKLQIPYRTDSIMDDLIKLMLEKEEENRISWEGLYHYEKDLEPLASIQKAPSEVAAWIPDK
eukprot:TRINITY_DN5833_c0_g1_i1.p1 TRINITY_DN5833_c0_g1~~TRINITY_DN5833_c0_g1_i1.p1  ORF type:complete len:150 (+),score=27.37 TRINITY_DN5833_c0_g1_i1:64-513(+)